MQALSVLAGKEGDQRTSECAERLGDLEQETTEGRILGVTKKSLCHTPKNPPEHLSVLCTEGLFKRAFTASEGIQGDSSLGVDQQLC